MTRKTDGAWIATTPLTAISYTLRMVDSLTSKSRTDFVVNAMAQFFEPGRRENMEREPALGLAPKSIDCVSVATTLMPLTLSH